VSQDKRSPKILDVSWGRMNVEGLGVAKDYKLYPGGGREWDWTETGTQHVPGIQLADGSYSPMEGAPLSCRRAWIGGCRSMPVLRHLQERSVRRTRVTETREAVKIYNELADNTAVPGCSTDLLSPPLVGLNSTANEPDGRTGGNVVPRSPLPPRPGTG
jgi:hypothetical protein